MKSTIAAPPTARTSFRDSRVIAPPGIDGKCQDGDDQKQLHDGRHLDSACAQKVHDQSQRRSSESRGG